MAKLPNDVDLPHAASKPPASTSVSGMANLWLSLFEAADDQAKVLFEWSAPFWDPRLLQKRWLAGLGQAMDGYLRSTPFLELMHQCSSMSAPSASSAKTSVPPHEVMKGDSHR